MDDARFACFARAIAGLTSLTSRRGLLGVAASLPVVGGGLALLDVADSEAKKRKRKKKRKKKKLGNNGERCQANDACLSGACCRNVCRACCDNSDCAARNPSTPVCLNNVCVPCTTSPGNCPADTCCNASTRECVANCPGDEICRPDNTCAPPCGSHDDCDSNALCVSGVCRPCDVAGLASIQAAIDHADPGSTLYVCPGFYAPESGGNEILIAKPLTIIGAGDGPGETRLQGQVHFHGVGTAGQPVILRDVRIVSAIRGVWLQGGNLLMERCTVRGGASGGTGVDVENSALEMRRCNIIDITTSSDGGGLQNTGGSVILRNCRIEGNTAARGAGILTRNGPQPSSSVELHNTEVRGNTVHALVDPRGAGIWNFKGTSLVTISNDSYVCENDPSGNQCDGLTDGSRCFAVCPS